MVFNLLLLLIGVIAASSAVIFIKICTVNPILLASFRQLLAALLLTPLFFRELRRHKVTLGSKLFLPSILPGVILAVHFVSWITGARMTPAANSSLIVNLVPIAMPFLVFVLLRERINGIELVGTAVSLAGVFFLASFDFRFDHAYFAGDAIAFGSMLFYALYLALGRRNNSLPSIWLYVVPLYYVGGLVCLAAAFPFVNPFTVGYTGVDLIAIVGLAVGPTIVGHSIINYAMKVLRPQVTSLLNLGQFLFAGIGGYFFLGELPSRAFYLASLFIVAGAVLVILAEGRGRVAGEPRPLRLRGRH